MIFNSKSRSATARSVSPRRRWRNATAALLVGLAAALGARVASAGPISVGSNPGVGAVGQFVYQEDYAAWLVADLSDPVAPAPLAISPSLSAGRWAQELAFDAGFRNLSVGDTFLVQELLTIADGDFELRSWSQEILTPGWRWSDGAVFDNGTSELVSGLKLSLTPGLIGFAFDPIPVGTVLLVVKVLEYVGPDDAAPTSVLVQASTAVPEPGAATLAVSGLIALSILRRRRSETPSSRIS